MLTMPSVEAQNNFGALLDRAQREIISITRRGRQVVLVMSPNALQDHVDAHLAMQAEAEGYASDEETLGFLNSLQHA